MTLLGQLAHVEVPRPEAEGRLDGALLVVLSGARQVEVQGGGPDVRGGSDEAEPDLRVVARQQRTGVLRHDLPNEQLAPELRQRCWVLGVVRHGHQS